MRFIYLLMTGVYNEIQIILFYPTVFSSFGMYNSLLSVGSVLQKSLYLIIFLLSGCITVYYR